MAYEIVPGYGSSTVVSALGVGALGNTLGDTGLRSGSIYFSGGNNLTLSQITGAGPVATIRFDAAAGGGGYTFSGGMGTEGNDAGDTGYATQRLHLVGSDNITISGSSNAGSMTISIIGPTPSAANVSLGMSNLGNTAGDTGTYGNRFIVVGGAGIIGSQATAAGGSGTLSLINSWSTATTVSSVASANAVGANAGRFALEGHQHEGVFAAGVSNVGVTAGNTGTKPGRFVFAGSGGVTASQETAANALQTLHIQGPATATTVNPVSSVNVVGAVSTRYALEDHAHAGLNSVSVAGNTAGNTTAGAGSLVFAGGNSITLSGATAAGGMTLSVVGPTIASSLTNINLSAGSTSNNLSAVTFSNLGGVTWGLQESTVTAKVLPLYIYERCY